MKTLARLAMVALAPICLGTAPAPSASPAFDGHTVIVKMVERNASLRSFQARVHVDVRMLSFPFFSPKLDGTSYYKRPDNYEIVFDRVPRYAGGFDKLFSDVGDPGGWEKDQNVVFDGVKQFNGHPMLTLRLTKKIYSTTLDHALAYVDPSSYQVPQMEWYYRNGGKIVMTQYFRYEGPYLVVSQQHAEIQIPHVHAVADSTYSQYETNVAVDDSVFTRK